MFPLRLQTTIHRKKSGSVLPQFSWDNITQVKTLCSDVLETLDNFGHEGIPCNFVLILVGQNISQENNICSGHFLAIF